MSETKFTKGPWRATECEGFDESKWYIQFDGWLKDSTIAAMNGFCAAYSNAEADAHLISASPDLYESLEEARELFEMIGKFTGGELTRVTLWREKAEKALKKARGEAS